MTLLLAAFVLAAPPEIPAPPLQRISTLQTTNRSVAWTVIGDQLYYSDGGEVVCRDLAADSQVWRANPGYRSVQSIASDGKQLYVKGVFPQGQTGKVVHALSLQDGGIQWSLQGANSGYGEIPIGIGADTIYVSLKPGELTAYHPGAARKKWTVTLPKSEDSYSREVEAITIHAGHIVVSCDNITSCLEPVRGQIVWQVGESYLFGNNLAAAQGVVQVPHNNGLEGREIATG